MVLLILWTENSCGEIFFAPLSVQQHLCSLPIRYQQQPSELWQTNNIVCPGIAKYLLLGERQNCLPVYIDFQIFLDTYHFLSFPTFKEQLTLLVRRSTHLNCLDEIFVSEVTESSERMTVFDLYAFVLTIKLIFLIL